jgi:hypothetical protein
LLITLTEKTIVIKIFLLNRLTKFRFCFQVVTLQEAKLLLKEDDDLIIAVYDYWLNKRLRLVSLMLDRTLLFCCLSPCMKG